MNELKKCPFCGGEAYVEQIPENTEEERKQRPNWNWNFPGMWVAGCRTPSCLGRLESFNSVFVSRRSAVNKWNDRPTGKWVHLGGGEYSCNACGNVIHTEGSWEKPWEHFCPACGMEMEGAKDDT